MSDHDQTEPTIGWPRALLTTAVILVVGLGALVYGTNAILTKIHGKTRGSLVAVATIWFFVVLFLLAWAMRRAQARKIV